MATQKTLPNGQKVTIPAYNESADVNILGTDISNLADCATTLNGNINRLSGIKRVVQGQSSNRNFSFTLEDGSHALLGIAAGFASLFNVGGTLYNSGLPSGFSASIAGTTATLTRNNDTIFIVGGIVV